MEVEQALDILTEVCATVQTNLAQHQTIQRALEVVRQRCLPGAVQPFPNPKPEPKK